MNRKLERELRRYLNDNLLVMLPSRSDGAPLRLAQLTPFNTRTTIPADALPMEVALIDSLMLPRLVETTLMAFPRAEEITEQDIIFSLSKLGVIAHDAQKRAGYID